jgi:hypothetical protein
LSRNKFKKYEPKSFEAASTGKYIDSNGTVRTDTFARMYQSMLDSKAFLHLNDKQKVLYLYAKTALYGARKPKADKSYKEMGVFQGEEYFYFNWAQAKQRGLYKPSMASNFYRDMQSLEEHGFIEKVASGKQQRRKNVYKFSDKWQKWIEKI